jgi:hypothetical protein
MLEEGVHNDTDVAGDHKARLMIMLIELGDGTGVTMQQSGPQALT